MKKTYILLFSILIALFSSCAVYEDVYFANDGKIKYEMLIDGSGMLSAMPDVGNKLNEGKAPKDTTILFSDAIKDKYPDFENMPQNKKDMLKKLEPFQLQLKNNPAESQLSVSLVGNFTDAQSMSEAFAAIDSLAQDKSNNESSAQVVPISSLSKLKMNSLYTWNGKSMSRKSTELNDKEDEDEDTETGDAAMMNMLMGNGDYTVRYHFPSKVKSISNKDAMLSQDGKTVIVKVPLASLKSASNVLDIDVELEK